MSPAATVVVELAGRRRALCLDCGMLDELQRRRGAGVQAVARRLWSRTWRVDDVLDVLRLGLAGAGVAPVEAEDVAAAAMARLRSEAVPAAMLAMGAAFNGLPEVGGEKGRPVERPVDFARFRAKLVEFGVSPVALDRMSLGGLLSTFAALGKTGADAPTDAEFDEIMDALRALNDPTIRLH